MYNEEQRNKIIEDTKDKVVKSLEWDDGYWVMTFADDSEMCFKFMAELQIT